MCLLPILTVKLKLNIAIEFSFQFSAETEAERAEWTKEIQKILETPLLPQVLFCFHGYF